MATVATGEGDDHRSSSHPERKSRLPPETRRIRDEERAAEGYRRSKPRFRRGRQTPEQLGRAADLGLSPPLTWCFPSYLVGHGGVGGDSSACGRHRRCELQPVSSGCGQGRGRAWLFPYYFLSWYWIGKFFRCGGSLVRLSGFKTLASCSERTAAHAAAASVSGELLRRSRRLFAGWSKLEKEEDVAKNMVADDFLACIGDMELDGRRPTAAVPPEEADGR
ncbi:arginine/serine-rich splicing factor 35 [Striga asiatica]|uniref:Arginine/serine-rich splicing factor 35 n=1 Tax=Striga asiatica TaxID=4170 RepID=A0A5A7P583_STRAF|nr:arginine/serine-rich splicing factor 35 [Striga asiatica]